MPLKGSLTRGSHHRGIPHKEPPMGGSLLNGNCSHGARGSPMDDSTPEEIRSGDPSVRNSLEIPPFYTPHTHLRGLSFYKNKTLCDLKYRSQTQTTPVFCGTECGRQSAPRERKHTLDSVSARKSRNHTLYRLPPLHQTGVVP